MKIRSFEDYVHASIADRKAYRERAVREVLKGGKRRAVAKRYDIDVRTLKHWVCLHASNIKPAKKSKGKRSTGKKRRVVRKRGRTKWKQERLQTRADAVAAVEAGEKRSAVAKRFGVTRQTIDLWVNKTAEAETEIYPHGLRHLSEKQRRKVRRRVVTMVGAGISQAATARRYGVSELSVGKWVKLFEKGGASALDIVPFEGSAEKLKSGKAKEKEVERFHLRFDAQERPMVVDQTSGKRVAENFIGKTVACHHEDHDIIGAYFDKERGIVLSYIHVPINEDLML